MRGEVRGEVRGEERRKVCGWEKGVEKVESPKPTLSEEVLQARLNAPRCVSLLWCVEKCVGNCVGNCVEKFVEKCVGKCVEIAWKYRGKVRGFVSYI